MRGKINKIARYSTMISMLFLTVIFICYMNKNHQISLVLIRPALLALLISATIMFITYVIHIVYITKEKYQFIHLKRKENLTLKKEVKIGAYQKVYYRNVMDFFGDIFVYLTEYKDFYNKRLCFK